MIPISAWPNFPYLPRSATFSMPDATAIAVKKQFVAIFLGAEDFSFGEPRLRVSRSLSNAVESHF
jgi:hypothetical protein